MRGEVVVVTGASGCLGHQLLRLLISHDADTQEIRCIDLVEPHDSMQSIIEDDLEQNYKQQEQQFAKTGAASSSHQTQAAKSPARKRVKWYQGDIRDINLVERALDGADCVIHCAAKIEIWREICEQNAPELESIHVEGTENLLKASVRLGVHKFVHVSSFETFVTQHAIYYATENTLFESNYCLFGPSGQTKKAAESKVKQYSNNKLKVEHREGRDSLNAVIIRFTMLYGEYDKYYLSKILELTKFFGGKLQRFTNIWIRQQPIYVGNAAWALIKAKQRMDHDESISGEDFHITDETPVGDPFDFAEPFVEAKGFQISKSSYPAIPVWFLIFLFFKLRRFFIALDIFGLFTKKKSKLHETIERDRMMKNGANSEASSVGQAVSSSATREQASGSSSGPKRWYHLITPQMFYFMCNSMFLNRTKANLRLDYEPLYDLDEAKSRSIDWYKNHLEL